MGCVIVTGGSRGIGKAIALEFAKNGNNVAILYVGTPESVEDAVAEVKAFSVEAKAYECDVTNFELVKSVVDEVIKDFGEVDVLVNNAGITADKLLMRMTENDFDRVISVNLKGAFNMIKHLTPHFARKRSGSIISISSVIGIMGNAGQANYAASKAGLIGLTKSVAKELGSRNITVNAIAPGFIGTEMTDKLSDEQKQAMLKMVPLGRIGEVEEVAKLCYFLSTAKYITAEVVKLDGGLCP